MGVVSLPDHKLCGFLYTVLSTTSPINDLAFGTQCQIFGNGCEAGFETENGIVFSLINPNASSLIADPEKESGGSSSSCKKKWSKIGVVNGSISVVHQLYALVTHKCLIIDARVVGAVFDDCEEVRVVVLVDVYLPITLWSGWQFPRAGSTAAALFRHLSCDWEDRSSMLQSGKMESGCNSRSAWNLCDCHVLNCEQSCSVPSASRKKLFELHEIFKNLPCVTKKENLSNSSRINPSDNLSLSGIWDLSDDILIKIMTTLTPRNLLSVSATCHHLRALASSVMPCMELKLFPHQHAAVEWMLQRERNSEVLPHPLFKDFITEDGFAFHINSVTGEIITDTVPTITDFKGGMFCDEPGLGKTITALSLILKTQGTLADPPDGAQLIWCTHDNKKCAYYELSGDKFSETSTRRSQFFLDKLKQYSPEFSNSNYMPLTVQSTRSWSRSIKRNLMNEYGMESSKKSARRKRNDSSYISRDSSRKKPKTNDLEEYNETWVQCDACRKWRKLLEESMSDNTRAWFCSMNKDEFYQSCSVPEESWDFGQSVTYLPGFYTKGTSGGKEENITFFTSVLREHYLLMNSETKKALTWLAKLSPDKLLKMETNGLPLPLTATSMTSNGGEDFHKIFKAFGLVKKKEKDRTKWCYPKALVNLTFDLDALKVSLCEPFNSVRLYLSRTTLVVVPSNLVEHWKNQIEKHVRSAQLRVYVWIDNKKPSAHDLAWGYDVVITTFSRLSAEWGPRKRSPLMQIHWLRVMFDEGHTLGSSLNLSNKLQISISLTASNRWLLTGTPTPNTPNSQLSHLQPMLKFLREETYGQNQKSFELGILRPFEAEMEVGRSRLLDLLSRCMISARKSDLKMIPPCIKKAKFLDFTEEHANSYNELVVTVRRNILMADWNDPSHVESLLNPKQWKFRSNTIRNVRLSCCVAGHIKVSDAGQDIQETMDIFVESGLDPTSEEYSLIRFNLLHGGNCARCKSWCRLPVITPCRHLLCLDCVGLDSEKCTFPGCGNLYEMQSPEKLSRPENPNPKWPVPKDLIELQPSYKQDDWNPDWQSTSSSKVSYLVHRLKELEEPDKLGSGDNNEFFSCPKKSPEKVLIFSQFLEHIHVIEQQLTFAGINFVGMYSPMHSVNKMKSLSIFQQDETCTVLLMDGSAALGLDLSFVTYVFLMEPIWDRSMEEQVISRAHRMGATRPINVETLVMRGTIEEQMLKFLMDADECRRFLKEVYVKNEEEGARSHRTFHDLAETNYLSQLSFVRTFSTNEN